MSDHPAPAQATTALPPDILDSITASLLAAIPPPPDSDPANRFRHETTLLAELDALHPRDLEEALLASEFLVAHHTSMRCFAEAARRKPGGRKASRLLRDATAQQRAAHAAKRALQKSQQRPMLEDPVDLVPRPTVPTVAPKPPPVAKPAGRAAQAAADGAAAESPPEPENNPFKGNAGLQALNDRWHDLPPWEQMTPEERREAFGYNHTPRQAAVPKSGAPAAT